MKIIHTADLHLDSRLEANLDSSKAKTRRKELVLAFEKMVTFAQENGVRLVLVAGDLFDHNKVTNATVEMIASIISSAPEIDFLLLSGNHDSLNSFEKLGVLPQNIKFFSEKWKYYDYENVTIAGLALNDKNRQIAVSSLNLEEDRFNIATLHLDIDNDSVITLNSLKDKNIDYLALGHLHSFRMDKMGRGVYAYSGCLEARGFDEAGKKGFVLIDTDNKSYEFISNLGIRTLYKVEVDISGLETYAEIRNKIADTLKESGASEKDMVKVVLIGEYTLETNKQPEQLLIFLKDRFYFAKLEDKSLMKISSEDYKDSVSLKGEFVRNVLSSGLSKQQMDSIIMLGIRAIEGEDI